MPAAAVCCCVIAPPRADYQSRSGNPNLQDFQADLVLSDYSFAAGEALADLLDLPRAAMTIIVPVSAHTV